ncbi:tRNA adenosine(34) deaminase TadA [Eubacteriales bacterium OttesenSCG-928-M02]|nr:tRNA adenosine(34) deaminase TadA [Eubacteriales bacterium OttesenSCG-928-M02]
MDEKFMRAAIQQAKKAASLDEVPVGAVVVYDGKIIARGYNQRERKKDPTAHAELIAVKRAAKRLGDWRLTGCTVYVTLEPCPMCAGVMVNARVQRVVFGGYDPKAGYGGTLHNAMQDAALNHRCAVSGGVLEAECAALLTSFFREKRQRNKPVE